ncbi:hypothetical protein [Saccharothrix sp. HUAS TT1]|uniref:hypothetical protein n=1 Tax=unclassified Saccharothrix TaxID=2593673 RepID=UPI00345BD484
MTPPIPAPPRTSRVRSRALHADATPAPGRRVTARILAAPPWTGDRTSRVLGTATTWSDQAGLWALDLIPHTAFRDSDHVLVEVVESAADGDDPVVQFARVPPSDIPLWLGDLLVDPPVPPVPPWRPVKALTDLLDVDRLSLETAKPGDHLLLLPSGKWGASHGPLGLTVVWTADPDDAHGVRLVVSGFGGRGAVIDFGDGTPTRPVTSADPVPHRYGEIGEYEVRVTDVLYPAFTGTARTVIKGRDPRAHLFVDSDDDWAVLLWIDEPDDATRFTVDWGDGTREVLPGQRRVPPRPRVRHQYGQAAVWTITVTDLSSQRTARLTGTTGDVGMAFVFDDSAYTPRAICLWLRTGATWELYTDDGSPSRFGTVPASGRISEIKNEPMDVGSHRIGVREYVDDLVRRDSHRVVTIPNQWDWRLDVWFGWRREHHAPHPDPAAPAPQIVRVAAKNARVDCLITWGDESPPQTIAPGVVAVHDYALPMPREGRLLRLEERQELLPPGVQQRVFSRLLGEPRHIGTPMLNARSAGAVDLHIGGMDTDTNGDWYQVNWGESGAAVEDGAALGRWWPALHTYRSPGTYRLTIDAPGMPEPVVRTVTVVDYPSPLVTVTEDPDAADPAHLTALVTVDNTASGGPARVDFGDGSPPVVVDELGAVSHRYPDPAPAASATYWVIAAAQADPTAKGRRGVAVPFPEVPPDTLDFTVDRWGDNAYGVELVVTRGDQSKEILCDWDDGTGQKVTVNLPAHHAYVYAAAYTITVGYGDGSESKSRVVPIPWAAPVGSQP